MKKILLITQIYYPHNSPCSHRIHSFARHLPKHGFDPTIVCFEWTEENCRTLWPLTNCYDEALAEQEACRVVRVPLSLPRASTSQAIWARLRPMSWPPGLLEALKRTAEKVAEEESPDVLLATSPPGVALAAATKLSVRTGTPWVADMRDIAGQFTPRLSKNLARTVWRYVARWWGVRCEAGICRRAAAAVTVSVPHVQTLRSRGLERVGLVYNGFEPDDYAELEPRPSRIFRVVYAGTLTGGGDPSLFLSALDELLEAGQISAREFEVDFYGQSPVLLAGHLAGRPCAELVHARGRIPRKEFLAVIKSASMLLLVAHNREPGIMTSKVFEYLGAKRPILAVPRDGGVIDELLSTTGAGTSAGSVREVRDLVLGAFRQWQENGSLTYSGNPGAIAKYTREAQAGRLAGILSRVVADGRTPTDAGRGAAIGLEEQE